MSPVMTVRDLGVIVRAFANTKRVVLLSQIARVALDSLNAHKIRFILTALGMIIGSASVVLVVTIGLTGKEYVLNLIQGIGSNWVWVERQGDYSTEATALQDYLTREDLDAVLQQVPGIVASSVLAAIHEHVSVGSGLVNNVVVLGVSPGYRAVRNIVLPNGRFIDEQDARSHNKVAVVTTPFATKMFGSATAAIGRSISIGGVPLTVVGTFRERVNTFGQSDIADQTILIPYPIARYFIASDNVDQLSFSMRDSRDVPDATLQIQRIVTSRHRKSSVYVASNLTQIVTLAASAADALTLILVLLSAVTLAVSGVGIMNIMLANINERLHEIGIRKAVGATFREIQIQFLMEAVLISLAGGVIGILLGLAVPVAVGFFTSYEVPLSAWSVVVALLTTVCVGAISGTLPATRAAQMDPVESLRYD